MRSTGAFGNGGACHRPELAPEFVPILQRRPNFNNVLFDNFTLMQLSVYLPLRLVCFVPSAFILCRESRVGIAMERKAGKKNENKML